MGDMPPMLRQRQISFVCFAAHNQQWLKYFRKTVLPIPEVMEAYRMAGQWGYLLKVQVQDLPHCDRFYKYLVSQTDLYDVTSTFAMEHVKYTTKIDTERLEGWGGVGCHMVVVYLLEKLCVGNMLLFYAIYLNVRRENKIHLLLFLATSDTLFLSTHAKNQLLVEMI